MKVLVLNGSPKVNGNTATSLNEVIKVLNNEGIETELIQVGNMNISPCKGCRCCHELGKCVIDDEVNEIAKKFENADGLLIGTPVYYASANGNLLMLLQRLFYSIQFDTNMKVGACIACARRAGTTVSLDELNRFFTINNMPIVPSTYWNNVYGNKPQECVDDLEGIQTMHNLGKNMAFMIKAIHLGKEKYGLPIHELNAKTNFIR